MTKTALGAALERWLDSKRETESPSREGPIPSWNPLWGPPPPEPPPDWESRDARRIPYVTAPLEHWWRYRHRGVLRMDYRAFGATAQRGRPRKPEKLSSAEKQRRYRQRLRAKRMQEN
jgi:hypothetical protein